MLKIKILFITMLSIFYLPLQNMEIVQDKQKKYAYAIHFYIRLHCYCSPENKPAQHFLEQLNVTNPEDKRYYLSWLREPFQAEDNFYYNSTSVKNYAFTKEQKSVGDAYSMTLSFSGTVLADSFKQYHKGYTLNFLEWAIIAAFKEYQNKSSLTDLEKTLCNEWSFINGTDVTRSNYDVAILKNYFSSYYRNHRHAGKLMYNKLLNPKKVYDKNTGKVTEVPVAQDFLCNVICENSHFEVFENEQGTHC